MVRINPSLRSHRVSGQPALDRDGESDPQHRVKLAVDEWGAWHLQDPSLPAGYLYGYPGTLRER